MKSRLRARTLALSTAAAVALGMTAAPSSANAAAFTCTTNIIGPAASNVSVYARVELKCNLVANRMVASIAMYRNGVYLDSEYVSLNKTTIIYASAHSMPCVSGNYHLNILVSADYNYGVAHYWRSFLTTPVSVTC